MLRLMVIILGFIYRINSLFVKILHITLAALVRNKLEDTACRFKFNLLLLLLWWLLFLIPSYELHNLQGNGYKYYFVFVLCKKRQNLQSFCCSLHYVLALCIPTRIPLGTMGYRSNTECSLRSIFSSKMTSGK